MNKSKVGVNAFQGKLLSFFGYFFGVMGLLEIPVEFINKQADASILVSNFLLSVAFGAFGIIKGRQIKERIKRFNVYMELISNKNITSLDNIAVITNQPVDFVRKDLQNMIYKKFFTNAYLDLNTNEIIVGGVNTRQQAVASQTVVNTAPEMTNVKCPGCGAMSTRTDGVNVVCEYCGTTLR